MKVANPIINLQNKRSIVFSFDAKNELAEISDEVCKLYMNVDSVVIDEHIYSFNYKIEEFFDMEKTMQKVKVKALEEIMSVDAFEDEEQFEKMAKSYKAPRTFITLKKERIERIKVKGKRKKVAEMLKIEVNADGKFRLKNIDEVSLLIRYLCFKIFKDDETKELFEANNVTQISL